MFPGEGVSPMALISIQTGWDGDGKHCDLADGDYTDVETVVTKGSGGFRVFSCASFTNILLYTLL